MILKKCPMCLQRSLKLKNAYNALLSLRLFKKINCQEVHQSTQNRKNERVAEFSKLAQGCCCENFSLSEFSPGLVNHDEILARYVFLPIHISKSGSVKSSLFSQVETTGCSIQRDSKASDTELVKFITEFLCADDKRSWKGVTLAKCSDVKSIMSANNRSLCVYDTANKDNPAHGEIFQSHYSIKEADGPEIRAKLFEIFNSNNPISPQSFKDARLWNSLPDELKR